eukprot:7477808-Lingulodinium_polyedra.AAC.1
MPPRCNQTPGSANCWRALRRGKEPLRGRAPASGAGHAGRERPGAPGPPSPARGPRQANAGPGARPATE